MEITASPSATVSSSAVPINPVLTVTPLAEEANLTVGRNIKIGFFHLGSGMADVLTTGVWNRIMISDLGFAATPIGLLVSLRYFLAPLGVWAGRMSDQRTVFGFRRLFWIWFGRALMVASVFMLGLTTTELVRGAAVNLGVWLALAAALFLFSFGSAISGSAFLALIYDRSHPKQRGRAVGIVWTFLLLGFTLGGILFAVMLPSHEAAESAGAAVEGLSYTPETLEILFLVGGLIMGALWFGSLAGEEKRIRGGGESAVVVASATDAQGSQQQSSVWKDLRLVWDQPAMRFFCMYLALSMLFAFSQDLILEPFAAEVFEMPARTTSRFAAYWGSMSILGTLVSLWLSRRYARLTNTVMSIAGVGVLIVSFAVFALSSLAEIRGLVTPGLILLGIGLGIWNVGTLGLMMDMSPLKRAGTFLGFWTLVVTLARGIGVSGGGIGLDLALNISGNVSTAHGIVFAFTPQIAALSKVGGNASTAYGIVFALGAVGLGVALWALLRVNVQAYRASTGFQQPETAAVFVGSME